MANASHILETAVLILVAFLIGATIGYLARRLAVRGTKAEAQPAAVATAPAATGPPLVTAPVIAPVSGSTPRRSAAERLAAAAARDHADEAPAMKPARTAGEATAGVVVPPPAVILAGPPESAVAAAESVTSPEAVAGPTEAVAASPEVVAGTPETTAGTPEIVDELPPLEPPAPAPDVIILPPPSASVVHLAPAPPVLPEPLPEPVVASAVPPIDEAAQVVDRPIAAAVAPEPTIEQVYGIDPDLGMPVPIQAAPTALAPPPSESPPAATDREVDENAAMRAIEGGNWRPRKAAPSRPVPHPEQAGPAEADAAMATARSAVASATAAAAAAIAESVEAARERRAASIALDFEPAHEQKAQPFLGTEGTIDTSGLSFENKPRVAFGQPEGLPAPRDGQPDNLRQIKGVTPQLESSLNQLGIFHFDQIASWDQKASHWMDSHLALKGRLAKEKWIEQARDLSSGRGRPGRPMVKR